MSLIGDSFKNIKSLLFMDYLKAPQEEDIFMAQRLNDYLNEKNGERIKLFAFFEILAGIVYLFAGGKESAAIPRIVGCVLLIAVPLVFLWLVHRELSSKERDQNLLRLIIRLHWGIMTGAFLLLGVSEYMSGYVPYSFFLLYLSALCVPVMRFGESALLAAVLVIMAAVYGALTKAELPYYVACAASGAAFLWLSCVQSGCVVSLWLGEYRLETAEMQRSKALHTDVLTGLLNKQGLSESFSELLRRENGGGSISVILIDIDNFRAYNHMYGYDKSDKCLSSICSCIKIMSKPYTKLISRFGGDDFVLIFEDMAELKVVGFAEQLRQSIERMALPFGDGIVTVSIGISGIKPLKGKQTYSELLNEADDQLYIAKRNGKNCLGYKNRPYVHESRKPTAGF